MTEETKDIIAAVSCHTNVVTKLCVTISGDDVVPSIDDLEVYWSIDNEPHIIAVTLSEPGWGKQEFKTVQECISFLKQGLCGERHGCRYWAGKWCDGNANCSHNSFEEWMAEREIETH